MTRVEVTVPDYGLVNNPIPVSIVCDQAGTVRMLIDLDDSVIYEGSYYIPQAISIDISDILKSIVSVRDSSKSYDITEQLREYRIRIIDEDSKQLFSGRYHAVWGGISKFYVRNASVGNYIEYRLANNASLSTRTHGKIIILRETEITPLKVLGSPDLQIQVVSLANHVIPCPIAPLSDTLAIHTLDISAIRKKFFSEFDELPAYLSFLFNGILSFILVFTPGAVSANRYLLRFRNSLGCYEQLEVTGKSELTEEMDAEDNSEYMLWDQDIMDYVTATRRKRTTSLITAETGFKDHDELMFLRDMLASDDIYLIDSSGLKSKVLVSSEDFKIPAVIEEPVSVPLKIKFADMEQSYSPNPDDGILETYPGEWFLARGRINAAGLVYTNNTINTI